MNFTFEKLVEFLKCVRKRVLEIKCKNSVLKSNIAEYVLECNHNV